MQVPSYIVLLTKSSPLLMFTICSPPGGGGLYGTNTLKNKFNIMATVSKFNLLLLWNRKVGFKRRKYKNFTVLLFGFYFDLICRHVAPALDSMI